MSNYEQKHEQLIKTISTTVPENFLEILSAVEYTLSQPVQEETTSLVPHESNFQLPNVFLKTKNSFEVEKLFSKTHKPNRNWNSNIEKAIDFINNIELKPCLVEDEKECDVQILETILKLRYGVKSTDNK